jgi:colanic acid biosynthesis glycosyl transferase WcaI
MRLTIVNQFYLPDLSPTAHLAASLAEHRAARGDQVTIVAGSGDYAPGPAADASAAHANPSLRRIWTPSLGKRSTLRRLLDYGVFFGQAGRTLLTLPRQDVVLLMTTPPYIGLTGILHRLIHRRSRLVLWSMDCYPETLERAGLLRLGGLASRALRGINRWLFRRLDCVVCLDEAMRLILEQAYAAPGGPRFLVIPNWEPAAMFPPGSEPPPWEGVARLGLQGKQVVLYLGNAGTGHRFDTVLKAAAQLSASDHAFVFIGGGSAWPVLQAAQESERLANVILEGYVPKEATPVVLGAADAALITLRDEMMGVMSPSKLHAALAMALPIVFIGPAGGNVHEAIERFGCGISLRHGDSDGLVSFLERLRSEPVLRDELGRRARLAFETAYTDHVGLARFDSLLDGQPPVP